jgi:hypothetical protein
MLQNRIPIRHAGDVIRHRAGAARTPCGGSSRTRLVTMLGGMRLVLEERPEQRFTTRRALDVMRSTL